MHKAECKVKQIVKEYNETLRKLGIKIDCVILYGSFAKKKQREDSDIDLIIVSEDFKKMNLGERQEVLGIAAVRIMKPIEARGYTPDELGMAAQASFLKEILEVGVSV